MKNFLSYTLLMQIGSFFLPLHQNERLCRFYFIARKLLRKNNVVLFFLSKLMAHVLIRFAFRV